MHIRKTDMITPICNSIVVNTFLCPQQVWVEVHYQLMMIKRAKIVFVIDFIKYYQRHFMNILICRYSDSLVFH